MAITQSKSRRSPTGARRNTKARSKRMYEMGSRPTLTKIGEKQLKKVETRGSTEKYKLLNSDTANVYDPKSKKYVQAKIKAVVESAASRHFVRRNIMTKGAIIDTDKGKAKVTSRPGQDGIVNAVLV